MFLLPGIGMGKEYSLWTLWAFNWVIAVGVIQLCVAVVAIGLAYQSYTQQHHFTKLPTDAGAPEGASFEPDSAVSIEMHGEDDDDIIWHFRWQQRQRGCCLLMSSAFSLPATAP